MTMMLPPLVIDVRVRESDARSFRIWFPFFLLWPLMLIIVGFALLVSLLIDCTRYLAGSEYHRYTLFLLGTLRVLAEVRGTHVHAASESSLVKVDIY